MNCVHTHLSYNSVHCTVTTLHGCGLGIYSNRREEEGVELLIFFSFETCIPAVQLYTFINCMKVISGSILEIDTSSSTF